VSNFAGILYIILLAAFIIYRRVRRSIGFQKFSRSKLTFRIGIFALIGIAILLAGVHHPLFWLGDGVGLAIGVALAWMAVKHSRFEHREDGWYYRTHIGIELSVLFLFLGRFAYRMIQMYLASKGDPNHPFNANPYDPNAFTKDPWTAAILFVIIAYYVGYFGYLLLKEKELKEEQA
jgi:hypothetical protein